MATSGGVGTAEVAKLPGEVSEEVGSRVPALAKGMEVTASASGGDDVASDVGPTVEASLTDASVRIGVEPA